MKAKARKVTEPGEILTPEQVAEILNVTTNALKVMRYRGEGPPWYRLGGKRIRYDRGPLEEWIELQRARRSA